MFNEIPNRIILLRFGPGIRPDARSEHQVLKTSWTKTILLQSVLSHFSDQIHALGAGHTVHSVGHALHRIGHALDNVGHALHSLGNAWHRVVHELHSVGHTLHSVVSKRSNS